MRNLKAVPALMLFAFGCGEAYDDPNSAAGLERAQGAEDGTQRAGEAFQNIPVVDQGAAQRPAAAVTPSAPPAAAAAPVAPASTCPAADAPAATGQGGTGGASEQQRATVREYIRKLMDETRVVPDTAAKKGGPRGSPGSFAKLSSDQVEQFVSAVIDGARLFLPKALTDEQRWALICAEISIESAFTPGTKGVNPGDGSKVSVGPLQLTLPQMWDDIFRQYANVPGLTHFDGSAWQPKDTQNDALENSIYDGTMAALWCITEQGRRGCPDWFGGPDGPLPKSMHTAYLAWVIGAPALKSGGDLAGQRDAYLASIETDLTLLGFDVSLVNSTF